MTLNLRFNYIGDAAYEIWDLQSFSRYPVDAFKNIPFVGYIVAIPFSLIITIPAKLLLLSHVDFTQCFRKYPTVE